MHDAVLNIETLHSRIQLLENELEECRALLAAAGPKNASSSKITTSREALPASADIGWRWLLEADEYQRYGRQLIMPEIGLHGQLSIRKASVLIVGVGGLGCPAAQYLAGAGVGTLGLVDGDTVELSNLHRQILHSTARIGQLKVDSAVEGLRQLNPLVHYVSHPDHLTPSTALDILAQYDLVLDCTDHPTSRYLISDACVLAGKPLVSASALRTDGQLMVLNNPPNTPYGMSSGPCYRCIFPRPPPPDSIISCGEGGILGPVVGVMGVLMALEAIKVITTQTAETPEPVPASMLIFSAYNSPPFRSIRLRGKRPECIACSATPTITKTSLASGSIDYVLFCGLTYPPNILSPDERLTASEFQRRQQQTDTDYLILDVRDETQFGLCHLPDSINIPISVIDSGAFKPSGGGSVDGAFDTVEGTGFEILDKQTADTPIYTICRFGNDSQIAVRKLKELGYDRGGKRWIGDIRGGLKAWKEDVDPLWPEY